MNLKSFRALMLVGMTACGVADLPEDVPNAEPNEPLASTESNVIVGSVNWTAATSTTGTIRTRSRAVGYLSIPARGSRCTAWLVSNDHIVTNNHCIGSAADASGAQVSFNYEDGVASTSRVWYSCSTFVRTWTAEDMTVLRCTGSPGLTYGRLTVSTTNAATGSSLYIIHQNCDYVATPGCTPTKKYSPGTALNGSYNSLELSYNADTLGGSSGSPVISASSHTVVGLHHVGVGSNYSTSAFNLGVKASAIRTRLAEIGL